MHRGKDRFMPSALEKRTRHTQLMQQAGVKLDHGKTHTRKRGNAALEYGP